MGRSLNLAVGGLLLLAACGNDVTIGGGANWPWPWTGNAAFFAEKTVAEDVPVGTQVRVRVEAVNGEVVITGQAGKASVTLAATLRVGSDTFPDAQLGLALLDVLVTDQPGQVLIQTQQPPNALGRQYLVYYTLTIPADLMVEVEQVNGYVTVQGIDGGAAVQQGNGNVQLSGVSGDADVGVANGAIDATVTLPPGGQITLTTGNGGIDLLIPATTSAQLSATVGTGVITWNSLLLTNVVQTSLSLTGTLGAGAGQITLTTGNGNIHVAGF